MVIQIPYKSKAFSKKLDRRNLCNSIDFKRVFHKRIEKLFESNGQHFTVKSNFPGEETDVLFFIGMRAEFKLSNHLFCLLSIIKKKKHLNS